MREQNRDDFYEGPPLEDEQTWHDGAIVGGPPNEADSTGMQGEPRSRPLVEVEVPEIGAYPLPRVIERPHSTDNSMAPGGPLVRDTSGSRAVDREALGVPVEDAGYDRSIEGESPGPLAPRADAAPPGGGGQDVDDEEGDLPAGQYGSSGARP
jgi:hypothetical protein